MAAVFKRATLNKFRSLWKKVNKWDCKFSVRCKRKFYKFTVNDNYAVRFGMGAIKASVPRDALPARKR
jgi:hypothetical protein